MRKGSTYKMIILTLLSVIEILLAFTPAGYLQIGIFYLTTLHIPVIVTGIYFGWKEGALLGFVFGMTSMLHAIIIPSADSIFFSPAMSGLPALIIALAPRIALGIAAAFLGKLFKKIKINDKVGNALTCILSTIIHTILVLSLIYLFFKNEYNELCGTEYNSVIAVIVAVLISNGLAESVLAAVIGMPLVEAMKLIRKRE